MPAADRRPLGATGLTVTALGLGTAPLGNLFAEVSDREARATLDAAFAAGVRLFDTAPLYGLGLAEERLGAALRTWPRHEVVVSTKVGRVLTPGAPGEALFAVGGRPGPVFDFSAAGVERSLVASLDRLGVDHVDVVLLHDPDDHLDQAVAEAYPVLAGWRAEGRVRAIGAGMNHAAPLARLVEQCHLDVVLVAGRWTLLDRSAADLLQRCAARGTAVLAGGPLNSGLLAGGRTFDYAEAPPERVAQAAHLAQVAAKHGTGLLAAALQFPLRHPAVAATVLGARHPGEVEAAVRALATPVPDATWPALG